MTALALPAFDATASGRFNKAEDISVIFLDRYGNEVGRRGIRSDDSVPLDKLPDYFVKATLATEDRRFYDHFGIDVIGTLRALPSTPAARTRVQGGSSITQQLAKNLFLSTSARSSARSRKPSSPLARMALFQGRDPQALLRPRLYGRRQFRRCGGAEFYFGKKVTDINLAEAAMLAGLFKAPTKYAPHVDLAAARGRANLVLSNLVDAGFLTEGQVTAAAATRRRRSITRAR
jgi:penicillin-binding protein 1A